MKKLGILVGILLFCAAGWAGATYVVGGKVEKRYFEILEQNARWGPITLSNESYQRGVLCSRAVTLLEMTVPKGKAGEDQEPELETVQVVFEHTLHHGPVPFATGPEGKRSLAPALAIVETRLVRFSPVEEDLEELLGKTPELKNSAAVVRVDFDDKADGLLRVPPFEKETEDARFVFEGLDATTKYDPRAGSLVGTVNLPQLEIRAKDGTLSWNGIEGRFDMVEVLPMLWVGKSRMVFGGMNIDFPGKAEGERKTFRMQEFEVSSESSFDGTKVQLAQVARFEGGTLDGEDFGPLVVDIEVKNLDGQVLSDFQTQVREVYRNAASADPDALAAGIVPLYADLFTRLLQGNPELNLRKFYIATPMGVADGTVRMKFAGPPPETAGGAPNPKEFLRHLESTADITVDEGLIRALLATNVMNRLKASKEAAAKFSEEEIGKMVDQQMESQLGMLAARNFIVRDGGKVKSHATLSQGELLVNGQQVPIFQDR